MNSLNNRIPPPFLFAFLALAMAGASLALPGVNVFGGLRWPLVAVFFLLALIGVAAVRGFTQAKTTIDPVHIDRASRFVTSGAFSITRNPMYVSMACLLVALAFYLSVPWLFLGPVLFVLFITRFQIIPEERVMTEKFGDAYATYRERVRRWI